MRCRAKIIVGLLLVAMTLGVQAEEDCITCHEKQTPLQIADYRNSKHASNDVSCDDCHGSKHNTADDVAKVELPTIATCADCHQERVDQYNKGKHALAWTAMKAMPTTHSLPTLLTDGMKGCGGCHKIGAKSPEDIKELRAQGINYGTSACGSCHTRHSFSVIEARQPQACRTCHMGFDHPQWEMYSSSKHGVRYLLKQNGTLPENTVAPTCQTCHMPDGDHEVRTPWGFLAVRLPLPEDKEWAADQVVILKALGVLDMEGNPTPRYDIVKAAQVARLTKEDFDNERKKITTVCKQCHSATFVNGEMSKGDEMIQKADRLLAQAILIIADLYKDGVIIKPDSYAHPYPDLLAFQDAPTAIEQRLFKMHLKHRMRAFQGVFHANPDYAFWYGWSEMVQDLTYIKESAAKLRLDHQRK